MKKLRILLFEDNKNYLDSLVMLINMTDNMECVGHFPDGSDIVEKVIESKPDVVLMDIDMPRVNGIESLILLRKHFPDLKILMQTVFEDDDKVFACICAGADGYMLKKASPNELLKGIEEVMEGGAPMTPTIARQVLRLMNRQNNPPQSMHIDFNLTEREIEILGWMVKGLSYKMIADKCNIATPTVNAHVRNIYEKLQVHSVGAAVAIALEKKLI